MMSLSSNSSVQVNNVNEMGTYDYHRQKHVAGPAIRQCITLSSTEGGTCAPVGHDFHLA